MQFTHLNSWEIENDLLCSNMHDMGSLVLLKIIIDIIQHKNVQLDWLVPTILFYDFLS